MQLTTDAEYVRVWEIICCIEWREQWVQEKWCERPGRQKKKERQSGFKMNILNTKINIPLSTNFKL
jgi:hypothetical protein